MIVRTYLRVWETEHTSRLIQNLSQMKLLIPNSGTMSERPNCLRLLVMKFGAILTESGSVLTW